MLIARSRMEARYTVADKPLTIEEQIAQLEAMRERLLPHERAARAALEPVRLEVRERREVLGQILKQIGVLDDALAALGVSHEPMEQI